MPLRLLLITSLLLGSVTGASAQVAGFDWSASAGVGHRRLVERDASGATLVLEDGVMGRIGLRGVRAFDQGAAVAVEAGLSGGLLDYQGQTQFARLPLSTRTAHVETEFDVLLRPFAPAAWGEAWVSLGRLDNRRFFHGTATTRQLYERSEAIMLGARWRSPGYAPLAGWNVNVEADFRQSLRHELLVDFHGLVQPSRISFEGGRKQLLKLRTNAQATGSPWTWTFEWARLTQGESPRVALGAGAVFQPELSVRDVALVLSRRF